jgi:hypothetical protein
MKRKPLAQWRAIRALVEREARPTIELVAQAAGRSARMIEIEAEREGWVLDREADEDIGEKVRDVARMLLARIEEAGRTALENGGKINKSEIDALAHLIKSLNGLAGLDGGKRTEEIAKQKQIKTDDYRAAILTRINERIVELAQKLAATMVGERDRPGRG